jgi:hypothetical protein
MGSEAAPSYKKPKRLCSSALIRVEFAASRSFLKDISAGCTPQRMSLAVEGRKSKPKEQNTEDRIQETEALNIQYRISNVQCRS